MDLVPIKIKIGLKENGQAQYPNFNQLTAVGGMDWSKYIDVNGSGWLYDCCGHKEQEVGSPMGQQWGVILVPKVFADEAVAAFPSEVTKLTEVEVSDFYDNKHAKDFPDEEIDNDILQGIKLKQDLGQQLTLQQVKALDPDDDTPGVRKNKRKVWTDYKALKAIKVVQ